MRKHRLYPRYLADFPRYHPPYPIPYAIVPKGRTYDVVAEPSRWKGETLPKAGVRFVHSPYVYEDPFLFAAQNIRYNTVEPLVSPLPYTYGFERQGSYNRWRKRKAQGSDMPTEEMMTRNTSAPSSGLWGNIAKGLSSTFASMKSREGQKKRQTRRAVRRSSSSSSSISPRSSRSAGSGFWNTIWKKHGMQVAAVRRQSQQLLTDLPPRTTNRHAQQVKQQMIGVGPMMSAITPIQAHVANQVVSKKESSNTALIVGGSVASVAVIGGLAWWFKTRNNPQGLTRP